MPRWGDEAMLKETVHYLQVLRVMVVNCLVREMQFKTNFLIRIFTEILWLGMQWVFIQVLYGQTRSIGGWDKWQMIALLGTNHLINQVFEGLFFDNCMRLTDQIRKGELDFVLVKPMSPQFLVSFRYSDYASFANALLGFGIVSYAISHMSASEGWAGVAWFLLFSINGVAILYALVFTLSTLTFWIGRANNLFEFYWQLGQFSRYPAEIYRWLLRMALLTVLPMLVVTNYPAAALFRPLEWWKVGYGLGMGLLLVLWTVWIFQKGLQRYRSASS
jgi:ABC-2 type transport system permease protein